MNQEIAIVSFAKLEPEPQGRARDEAEMVQDVVERALGEVGLTQDDVGFVVSGSSDYLIGRPFSFVAAVDGLKAWPPIRESHLEMDGAFALYEAWLRLLHGDIDVAVAIGFGFGSLGAVPEILHLQNDPYFVQPIGLDALSSAALQARVLLDAGLATEQDFAEIAARNHAAFASRAGGGGASPTAEEILQGDPMVASPLRASFCPRPTDGAAAVVLATAEKARELRSRPAFIRGIDHRIEAASIGQRDLSRSESARIAGQKAGVGRGKVDVAELHASFAHEEILLAEALGLDSNVSINPSGGALAENAWMVAGLVRFGEAAGRIFAGEAERAVAHSASGACLQQNLVAILEAE